MTVRIELYGIEVLPMKNLGQLAAGIADSLQVPEELVGAARLSLTAGKHAVIENHRGVLDYSPERIVVSTHDGSITLLGDGLRISAMSRDVLIVRGRIHTTEWGG